MFTIPHSDKYLENDEAIAGSCWPSRNQSAQEGPEVATIWCLSCGGMKEVGGISPVPGGQVFETQSHPYNWHPWWGLRRQARIKSRGDRIALPPGASSPSRAGLRLNDRDWAATVKTSAVLCALLCREIASSGPQRSQSNNFHRYCHIHIILPSGHSCFKELEASFFYYYQKNNIIHAEF